ncbi:hypothetical protein HF086_005236 [Spodoptera exigua]|uniref:Ionotropic receptor n=1 Tax=Spodoptera exigua TaxID=7107 RepID=A0A922SP57_SPOEX|nr:hypothetical protein HF086_005236 [Spodoptera exigua]
MASTMLAQAIVEFFKHKVVSSIIILACWPPSDQIKFTRELSQFGMSSMFSCDPAVLDHIRHHYLQGVIYMTHEHDDMPMFKKIYPLTLETATPVHIYDAYVHPRDGISINLWAHWTNASGLVLTHERERILRRLDLKKYPLRIATPVGHYSSDKYDGTFVDFLEDESISDQDPGIRSGYGTSMLLTEVVNAQVGFTYLSERESSSNMYLEPFSPGVWWSCLAMMAILALVERVTSKTPMEKDGAFYTVLTTWLQQEKLKFCLQVETTWDDLEYLKKKKKTSKFYQELKRGVELIRQGSTAFHSEYNQIYPHFKTFSDEQICKLQHVDTIPEWTEVLRTAGGWLLETGLGKRLVARLRIPQPPCRASLLAERVKLGDIASLLALTIFGAFLSVVLLGVEILVAKAKNSNLPEGDSKVDNVDDIPDSVEHSNYIE